MGYKLDELNRNGLPSLVGGRTDKRDWLAKRERIRREWLRMTGEAPPAVPVRYEIVAEAEEAAYRRLHIRYDTVMGDAVPAYLLIPRKALETPGLRLPAVLALHPTANAGKDDIALPSGRDNRRYALELAERGYVVLAPDVITAGERKLEGHDYYHTAPFDERHPEWSAVGKMLADHSQGVDLLCSLPFVDERRIGAVGHSLGGYNAYFLAGMDRRIAAVVSSCGLCTFYGDADPNRWGRRPWFSHLPRITGELERGEVPFDFHEIAALAAPTPFFCWIAQQDRYFPHWREIGEAAEELHRLYEFLGCADRFSMLIGNADHDFPGEIRALAYAFLDRWLGPDVTATT